MARPFAAALIAVAACGPDAVVIAPVIDSPPPGSDAAAFPDLDEVELSVAVAGDPDDLVSATFQRGDALELDGIPYRDDLVIHMLGRVDGSEVAAGRTCVFAVRRDEPPPAPHLYFARTVKWAEAAAPPSGPRIGGDAVSYADGSGVYLGGQDAAAAPVTGLDRFDPMVGVFDQLGVLMPRQGARAARLAGRIVIAGGSDATGPVTYVERVTVDAVPDRRVELFDAPLIALTGLALAELADGRVVAFGGRDGLLLPSAAVIEIRAEGSVVTTRLLGGVLAHPRLGHTVTRLSDDVGAPLLIAGGVDPGGAPVAVAELYKPLEEAFASPANFAPMMATPRTGHRAYRLPDGSVLFVGGRDAASLPVRQLERFSIDSGFVPIGLLPPGAGVTEQSLTPLPDGRILFAGGRNELGVPVDTAFIALLDPIDGVLDVVATDRLATPRAGHQATLLCDGTVVLIGGTDAPSPAERYNPPALGRR